MALKFPFKKPLSESSISKDKHDPDYEFQKAVNLFVSQRENLGFSIKELSNKTRISKNVLIAIENGWEKYLPEKTYLISMIRKLEIEFDLKEGSLNGILSERVIIKSINRIKFNFINIDFLNSWIGSLLYLIFMFLSILALNSQQKYLLKINSLSTEPVLLNEIDLKDNNRIKY